MIVYDKETGEVEDIEWEEIKNKIDKYIIDEDNYPWNLYDLWDYCKKPFIALNKYGWYVLILTDPHIQCNKYEGNIYGYISKDIEQVKNKNNNKQIYMCFDNQWKFIK